MLLIRIKYKRILQHKQDKYNVKWKEMRGGGTSLTWPNWWDSKACNIYALYPTNSISTTIIKYN